ncbi:MAG: NAD(P)(+) transhydrogenase (Re/Si-specific) subunit beta [bacterium]|nr:NAD(P)(+) transhydrogenase (Re/Si-specific) subunit beta [bacterium]
MEFLKDIFYLLSASLFIFGLKKLGSPKTARTGNLLSMIGMLIAVVVTLLDKQILDFTYIIVGVVVGSLIGAVAARKVEMTAMPQMVALFNAFGGGASALVALAQFLRVPGTPPALLMGTVAASILIGTVTFTGSAVAFAKLQGIMKGAPIVFAGQKILNGLMLAAVIGLSVLASTDVVTVSPVILVLAVVFLSGVLGITSVIPIGGADMPVVISLLNSYSGLAAAATGFVLSSNMLIIAGSLVGASGLILTNIMCKAMNRSLFNVLFGAVGAEGGTPTGADGERKTVTGYSAEDAVPVLETAQSVIIVPGYGLAVAQAQHVLQELASLLEENGTEVRYAIHPVAGRMPGHMNVLLAEANVSYDALFEMENINDDFKTADVALVIGANDVTNPSARTKKESPLYGMPILNVDMARTVMVVKRSLSVGFAGEDNPLFYEPKTMMLFGDAKKMVTELVRGLKE